MGFLSVTEAFSVGVVGASGVVGRTLMADLDSRSFPISELRLFGSVQSEGQPISYAGRVIEVERVRVDRISDLDLVFLCAGGAVSRELAPELRKKCQLVIDSSSAFRHDPTVPLIIPEVNGDRIGEHQGLVANPNCSTAIALMALAPLHRAFGLTRVMASTYQAVSGAGQGGLDELLTNTRADVFSGKTSTDVFGINMAHNILPLIGAVGEGAETDEETKMRREARRILDLPELSVATTCVRVPTLRVHGLSLTVEFERSASVACAVAALAEAEGVVLSEPSSAVDCPNPRGLEGHVEVVVTRLRRAFDSDHWLSFFCFGDQLKKGAATNAVQIAEIWQQLGT